MCLFTPPKGGESSFVFLMVKRKEWKRKERIKEGVNKPTEYEGHTIETLLRVTKETRVLKVTVRKGHQVVVTNDT